jgi:hypothetical protein
MAFSLVTAPPRPLATPPDRRRIVEGERLYFDKIVKYSLTTIFSCDKVFEFSGRSLKTVASDP